MIYRKTWTTRKTSWTTSKTSWNTLKTLWNIMKHSSFDASALDVEMSAIAWRSFNATISALNAKTSALGAVTSAIVRSYRRYRRWVFGDCGVGVTLQMCNRVTNHGDMGSFSRPSYILDIFARQMAHQSLCGDFFNLSTVPSISAVFQTNAI